MALAPDLMSTLRETVQGEVVTPEQGELYETARLVEAAAADLYPAAVVRAATTTDVQAVVDLARERGLDLAIRGGGHSTAGHGTIEGGVVLDLSGLKDLQIDPAARTARAGAGLTAGEYVRATGEHGLTTPFGDTAAVGIAGITLGGGMGLLTRRHGMTIDSLLGVEIVTADGQLRTVDADHEPELFWALRGGGGNFGVVTSLTFRLVEVASATGGTLVLPATAEVLSGFLAAAAAAPEELTTIVSVMPCPPVLFVAPEHHGRTVLFAQLVHVGGPDDADQALAPFRALATPLADLVATRPYADLLGWEEIPRVTAVTRTQFLDHVDEASAAGIIAAITDSPSPRKFRNAAVSPSPRDPASPSIQVVVSATWSGRATMPAR
jgi:FAD/FMN-containing dehydrogenase